MPDPVTTSSDAELLQHLQRVLSPHYDVEREIGRGGMGIVYRARDTRLKRSVAVKLLPPELAFRSEIRSRFLREAETAAQLSHPNIVPIYSVDERDGLVYFIMGYIDGGNVASRLHEKGALGSDEVRAVLREVADALAYAHARGVVHRDIKPDNILLCIDDGRPVVTDFGIARAVTEGADSRLTATGMAIGTPTYMSPEQAAGEREIDGRSDLYSLGVVGYQMLTGEPPFTASSTPALLVKHLSETPVPVAERRRDAAPDVAYAVMRMLEKDPANRFPSAAALVTALDERQLPDAAATATSARRATAGATGAAGAAGAPGAPGRDVVPQSQGANAPARSLAYQMDATEPTPDEVARWNAPKVTTFRKRVSTYLFVNAAIVLMAIFTGVDLLWVTAFWTMYMAFQYATLWADGFDWRDVFKQPRDRMMFDVAAETIDDARALFDPARREEVRARERARRARLASGGGTDAYPAPSSGNGTALPVSGERAELVRRAMQDRDEIVRLMASLPKRDRERLPDVVRSADRLVEAVQGLSTSLSDLERDTARGAGAEIEREIERLEAEANPLDAGSDERVRRLAFLKRQRRAVLDSEERIERDALRLDSCVLALQNMRLDLRRLMTGAQTPQQVTQLAEQAMSLAHDVDGLIMADEAARGIARDAGRGTRV
ncbi:MAG TPA: protein kinase [Gemmatimonadaceae bacterium]|nr:protein kinase [Gemmatimonadaceae bacterium]